MINTNFHLKMFPDLSINTDIIVTGNITRYKNMLLTTYELNGNLNEIFLPPLTAYHERKDNLWKGTCFELFIRKLKTPEYWEINLSPTGDWNLYSFSDMRNNMKTVTQVAELKHTASPGYSNYKFEIEFDLNKIHPLKEQVRVGVALVLKFRNNQLSYWALKHPKDKPDFHINDNFSITI